MDNHPGGKVKAFSGAVPGFSSLVYYYVFSGGFGNYDNGARKMIISPVPDPHDTVFQSLKTRFGWPLL